MSGMKRIVARSAAVCVMPLAASLCLSVSRPAMAACVPGPNAAISLDCSGVSSVPGIVVNSSGFDPGTSGDAGNMAVRLAPGSVFTNSGAIDVSIAAAPNNTAGTVGFQRSRLYGVSAFDPGAYEVVNSGSITVVNNGVGRLWGVAMNGDATEMTLTNSGTIQVTRGALTGITISATALQARAASLASGNQTLDVAAAAYAEEEAEKHVIENSGLLKATGQLTAGIFSRAGETVINNSGTILQTTPTQGFAVAKVSDSGEVRTLEMENSGTITGDVLAVGGNALRWWGLSNGLGGTIDARLNINSQFGQVDSTINNSGTITGKLYFGNGTHVLVNEKDGVISGDMNVDQRRMSFNTSCTVGAAGCFATATTTGQAIQGNPAAEADAVASEQASLITAGAAVGASTSYTQYLWGTKDFTFENAGTYTGNVLIQTQAPQTVGTSTSPDSKITLKPHVLGGGGSSSMAAPSENSGFIEGTLKIADGVVNGVGGTSSLGRTTTIAPVLDGMVKSGEWYLVARHVDGVNVGDNPAVTGSALVTWSAETTGGTGDALVIGASVADAKSIAGLSRPGVATVNALNAYSGSNAKVVALGAALQSLETAEEVRKAGEQLRPTSNGAALHAPVRMASMLLGGMETRLAAGFPGVGGSAFSGQSNLGMQPSREAEAWAPSWHLGAGSDEAAAFASGGGTSQALWGQVFGQRLDQKRKADVSGYQADVGGLVVGYDNWVSDKLRVGGALSYGASSADDTGDTQGNSTRIDSLLGLVYGGWRERGWYANAAVGYGLNGYTTKRTVRVGVINDTVSGDYDGQQFVGHVDVGAPMRSMWATLTPVASFTYNRLSQDAYSESSKAGAGLTYASVTNNSAVTGLGVKASVPLVRQEFDLALEGRAVWNHEFGDMAQKAIASFVGGATFQTEGPQAARDMGSFGAGLSLSHGSTHVVFSYDAAVASQFTAQSVSGRARVAF